ncbi:MAG TPA: SurA N-terminal domain-containing protein [Gemmatimonadales bacterium]|jgi:peptidyl-prolyl cis-trans isomerase D|nr:SurA N-terminal domain-containing protein [Gemmatimonadales bacterium]
MAMLREMRAISKYVFWVVAISFIGWLAYGQVQEILSGSRDMVLKIDGQEIHSTQFQQAVQAAVEQYQARNGVGQLPAEDRQQIENQVVDELVRSVLINHETKRLGITVTDQEIKDAAQTSPPPEVYSIPDFQTNGQFDATKWRRFLQSGGNQEFLVQLEARYRDQIPQAKLLQYITADLYVSDAKLWRIYRDQHDSVTVDLVAIGPEQIPDSSVAVTDDEARRYYSAHKNDFKRPAAAWLSFVALPRAANRADSAAALARADSLRTEASASLAKFEDIARRESSDTGSGRQGGDLGWIKRNQPNFDTLFLAGLRGLPVGQVSRPVHSSFGYHLLRIEAEKGDSLHVRHILVPIDLAGAHRDSVESIADSLDRIVAERDSAWLLDSAARRLHLPLALAPKLVDGDRMVLGRYVIPDVSVWAFEHRVGETSNVIQGEVAYYVFRLDSLQEQGVAPLAQVRADVEYRVRLDKKTALWKSRAQQIASALASGQLAPAAVAQGSSVQRLGPFTRLHPPPILQLEPNVLGEIFRLGVSQHSGALIGEHRGFVVQLVARHAADSAAWVSQRDAQRDGIMQAARQSRVDAYIAALRQRAKVVDRRKDVFRPQNTAAAGS